MHKFIVTAAKGLDELLRLEIAELLSIPDDEVQAFARVQPGQVSFEAELKDGYKICMCSRLANRVLIVLNEGKAGNAEELYKLAAQVDWPQQFSTNTSFAVQFVGVSKTINNTQFGALKVKDAIVDSFVEDGQARPNVERQFPGLQVHVRLRRESAAICIDLSGTSLHKRGYREATGDAPLKEQLAAAILYRSGWHKDNSKALLDPMCGSGTIAIEGAMIAAKIAPNINRELWGFRNWFGHIASDFDEVKAALIAEQKTPDGPIYAFDISTTILDYAVTNAENAGVVDYIDFKQCDALHAKVKETEGYIVCNPPYGERLDDYVGLLPMYSQLGSHLKSSFANWKVALLSSNDHLLKALKLRTHKRFKLFNGKIETQLALYQLTEDNLQAFKAKPNEDEFSNRLSKNVKRISTWLKKTDTNAYRVYDADLPNYNFAIDRYADWVIVQEYAPPKTIPENVAQERLAQALLHIPHILNVDRKRIVLKVRKKQEGKAQYQKVDAKQSRIEVYENQTKFLINPTDYLDVGLFLDHRLTRQHFAAECRNKHVLNLFCYTGSVSVHAAKQGAKSVTSVDMSNTYIQWAKDNFLLNNLQGAYEFVQANCLVWIARQNTAQKFDMMFIDPPSFSNSKRMDSDWDVQRDHVALLTDAKELLAIGGKIYFSNNLRSFKLDTPALEALGFSLHNITSQTIDEDFKRNQKIHHCWVLSL
ncbi:MAG: 23S rRNA (guanine2445-N2)-methyltransferase / 23S rRNA (guanine2069-N7)-methyltransferase [Alphaproteobacteria bacterium]|jgi:23S rRNA (guanine2445-N2)-methyltransferase / 23S rRNA (guanine2069-N7)-methyltransferase